MPDFAGIFGSLLLVVFAADLAAFVLPALWLAGEKGRNPLVWAIFAFFFGPLAILTVGLAPRAAGGSFAACPACREAVHVEAEICPFCRTRFAEAAPQNNWDPLLAARLAPPNR